MRTVIRLRVTERASKSGGYMSAQGLKCPLSCGQTTRVAMF